MVQRLCGQWAGKELTDEHITRPDSARKSSVILSAMGSGMQRWVPLLASDTGDLREVIEDGVSGVLFRPGDEDDLAEKLLHLLNDAPKRKSLAEAGRLRDKGNFTMELMAEGWLDCFRRVIRRGLR